jgi:ArsR family transcriptional regulator, lead/cadmium/zinc/bismuth-responsive transcriptional repressor
LVTLPVIFIVVKTSSPTAARVVALDRCEVECVEPERVRAVLERLPHESVFQDLAETFRVLSDPGRVRLISALLEAGELCVCDLAAVTGLSQTACSHNLRLLRSSRLVRYRKQGRNVYYSLDDAHIRLLLDVALQHVGHEEPGRG